jgi:vacuolar-type H+-ATPase subunit D/Vma8
MNGEQRTRAGRLRLIARLELATHASALLRSKEEVLERERIRLEGHAKRASAEWARICDVAASDLVRARMLGASGELARLRERGTATVTPDWQTSMGIVYPGGVECEPGQRSGVTTTAALRPAADSYRAALATAGQHAAASAAVERLDAELGATRRRRRAIEDRLQPALAASLHELDLHLDEADRDEALRVRMAVAQRKVAGT